MPNLSVDLNYENHLKIQLVKNPEETKPKGNNGFLIALIIILPFIITFALFISPTSEPQDTVEIAQLRRDFGQIPAQTPNNVRQVTPEEKLDSNQVAPFTPESSFSVRINSCNGANHQGANFRDYPTLTPSTILGIAPEGVWVTLTGKTANADGVLWYEAINDSVLWNSDEPNAQNRTSANQTGWIAACFIE